MRAEKLGRGAAVAGCFEDLHDFVHRQRVVAGTGGEFGAPLVGLQLVFSAKAEV